MLSYAAGKEFLLLSRALCTMASHANFDMKGTTQLSNQHCSERMVHMMAASVIVEEQSRLQV